jgi:hypothetical protein
LKFKIFFEVLKSSKFYVHEHNFHESATIFLVKTHKNVLVNVGLVKTTMALATRRHAAYYGRDYL